MKKMTKIAAALMVVAALTFGQSMLMAAPTQGATIATQRSASLSLFAHFMSLLGLSSGPAETGTTGGLTSSPTSLRSGTSKQQNLTPSTDGAIWGGSGRGSCRRGC